MAREEKYLANKGKAFALIYGQCNKALQHKLQARKDFETEIKENPIKLLDAISEHSMSYDNELSDHRIFTRLLC